MHGQFIFRKRTFFTAVSAGSSSRSRWNLVEAVLAKIKRRLRSQASDGSVDFTQPEDLVGNGWPSNNTRNGSPKAMRVLLNSMAGEDDVI